jgi:endoglucanase
MTKFRALFSAIAIGVCCAASGAFAQTPLAPAEIVGKAVYVPFPVAITIDGKADDWAGVPAQAVDRGSSPSKDPAENGSFSFSVAADDENFYILMLAKDKTILAGAHGKDTWNEDSMEFYLNLGENLWVRKFTRDVVQYRISAADIGNADPSKLAVSGANADLYPLRALVFKTPDGWGIEAAVKVAPKAVPAHGRQIGFQAQLNGATDKDRIVKLIWSTADSSDNSWQNPSLFGSALFFKTGSADVPLPKDAPPEAPKPAATPKPVAALSLNQVGYFAKGEKLASLNASTSEALPWTLYDAATGAKAAGGKTKPGASDLLSGDNLHVADFSSFSKPGQYYIDIGGERSPAFEIGNDVLAPLAVDSLRYFYLSRSGIELRANNSGKAWAREAGHLSDAAVPAFDGKDAQGRKWDGEGIAVNGLGGWYDAGDFGKYVVNGGISLWTLQNAYERNPARFGDGQLSIPESGNSLPDILDESRWELEFMLNMQIPAGKSLAGMAYHKLHDRVWSAVPSALPGSVDNNLALADGCEWGRFAYEPSTAATLNLAACAAQASRIWAGADKAFSERCLESARSAWKAALAHPALLAGNVPGNGGGNYEDAEVGDEFFWAAAELFAATGSPEYLDFLRASPYWKAFPGPAAGGASSMSWGDTAALGTLSLLCAPSKLPAADSKRLQAMVVAAADSYLEDGSGPGYRAPLGVKGYVWGSNSLALNNAIVLALAYDATKKAAYRDGVVRAMNYLLGYNGLRKSFVTGYGLDSSAYPHHRVWANDPESGYPPPPPGAVVGGPNRNLEDPEMKSAGLGSRPIAKRYLDAIGSFATNEVAINWNAPLAWVANWLDAQYGGK